MAAAAARAPGRCGDGNAAKAAAAVPEAVAGHVKVSSLLSTCHCAKLLGLSGISTALERRTTSPSSALLNASNDLISTLAFTFSGVQNRNIDGREVCPLLFQQSARCMNETLLHCNELWHVCAHLLLVVLHQAVLTHGAARVWPARVVSGRPHWLGIALAQSTTAIQFNSKGSVM